MVHALPVAYWYEDYGIGGGSKFADLIFTDPEAGESGGASVFFEYKTALSEVAQPICVLVSAQHHGTSPKQITSLLDRLHGTPKPDPLNGYEEYGCRNWDGYNAEPITEETLRYARRLLSAMPSTFGPPDIAPCGDGSIGLEWVLEAGPLQKLFLDIGPSEEWWAYWKRRTGEIGRLSGKSFTRSTPDILRRLFDDLSR